LDDSTVLAIEHRSEDGQAVVDVGGELDVHTCGTLEEAVQQAITDGGDVIVDLADVTFVDSSGLRTLIGLHRSAEERGGRLVLREPSRPLLRLLDLTGLQDTFNRV
jgi:anti-anti-sigma factor